MLSAPLYFAFGLGTTLVFLVLFLFLIYLSVRQKTASKGMARQELETGTIQNKLKLNARVSLKKTSPNTGFHLASSFNRTGLHFDPNIYDRVKKMLEEKKDIRAIAKQENLSLGEVRLLESLCK